MTFDSVRCHGFRGLLSIISCFHSVSGYGIQDEKLGFIVTAYPPNRDVNGFLACSEQSLNDMASVLEGRDFK